MLKTRFDNTDVWINKRGKAVMIRNMNTSYVLSCVRMMKERPDKVLHIIISDIDAARVSEQDRLEAFQSVTSLTPEKMAECVEDSPLFKAMVAELEKRGVDVGNILDEWCWDEWVDAESVLTVE